jgi:hypothetical protein
MKNLSLSNLRLLSHSFATSRMAPALQESNSSLAFGILSSPAGRAMGNARPWVSSTLGTSNQRSSFRREGLFTPWRMIGTQNIPAFHEVRPTELPPTIQLGSWLGERALNQKYFYGSQIGSLNMCWSKISASLYQCLP